MRTLLLFLCVLFNTMWVNAEEVKFRPLSGSIGHTNRTPIRIPNAYIDGHTLTFDASCIGCTLTLTQDDIIIYSATVEENENGEGEVVLPENLTGEFEVQIEFGSITLVGIIEL